MYYEGGLCRPPRELPELLKRGLLGRCFRIWNPCVGIRFCVFILRVQSFVDGARRRAVGIDHGVDHGYIDHG